MLNYLIYLNIIYKKTTLYSTIISLLAYNKVNLYYIYFIKLFNNLVYKIDSNISGPIKINIILKYNKNILTIIILEYIRYYIIKKDKDRIFNFLIFILDSNNLD